MVVYPDTSALLKLYIEEAGRSQVMEAVVGATAALTSTVACAEARAGLARRFREGDFTEQEHERVTTKLDEQWRGYERLAVSDAVALSAGDLAERYALRGFDAVHLASALWFSHRFGDLRFLAFDERLSQAARDASLNPYTN